MKKKILILCLVILLAIALILGIYFMAIKDYVTFVGAIENIKDNYLYIHPEDEAIRDAHPKLYYCSIPEESEHTWKIGDKLEIKYHKDFLAKDGYMGKTNLKYLGKTRLFRNYANIGVSNSTPTGGNLVFKSLYDYDGKFNKEEFTTIDNYSVKKIISYDEYLKYKELIPEIRTLTEDDFINYYLLIILSTDASHLYTLETYDETESSISLSILKHDVLSAPKSEKEPLFSGLSVVVPNRCDFDLTKVTLPTTSTTK